MSYEPHDTVVLVRDLIDASLKAGDVGAVVHVHPDGSLEVEFVTASGRTTALVTLPPSDVRAATDSDQISVRNIARSA